LFDGHHYHLVIETPDGNLSKGMRQLNGIYTQAFNRRHRRVVHLFQGRFKRDLGSEREPFSRSFRYVVLNSVRAEIAKHPREWVWSSYRATSGVTTISRYLTVDEILTHFGRRRGPAQEKYRNYVKEGMQGLHKLESARHAPTPLN
jgi:REP-associated tyrosine transposase